MKIHLLRDNIILNLDQILFVHFVRNEVCFDGINLVCVNGAIIFVRPERKLVLNQGKQEQFPNGACAFVLAPEIYGTLKDAIMFDWLGKEVKDVENIRIGTNEN